MNDVDRTARRASEHLRADVESFASTEEMLARLHLGSVPDGAADPRSKRGPIMLVAAATIAVTSAGLFALVSGSTDSGHIANNSVPPPSEPAPAVQPSVAAGPVSVDEPTYFGFRRPDERVVRIDPDGTETAVDPPAVITPDTAPTVAAESGTPCEADTRRLEDALARRSVTVLGHIVAIRDVCPNGLVDEAARSELVRVDGTGIEVLASTPLQPAPGTIGGFVAVAASPDANLVAVAERTSDETPTWSLRSTDDPANPLVLPSNCDRPGDVLAAPAFLTDGRVAIGRPCGEELLVELLDQDLLGPSVTVATGERLEFPGTSLIALSTTVVGTEPWIIASVFRMERAVSSVLIGPDQSVTDISRPGYGRFAFTPAELLDDIAS